MPRDFYNYPHSIPSQFQGTKVTKTTSGNIFRPDMGAAIKQGVNKSVGDIGPQIGGAIGNAGRAIPSLAGRMNKIIGGGVRDMVTGAKNVVPVMGEVMGANNKPQTLQKTRPKLPPNPKNAPLWEQIRKNHAEYTRPQPQNGMQMWNQIQQNANAKKQQIDEINNLK